MSSTPRRKNISLEEKYEIIQAKQKGMSTKEIAEKYVQPASTISSGWMAERELKKLDLFDIFRLFLIFIHILCINLFLH